MKKTQTIKPVNVYKGEVDLSSRGPAHFVQIGCRMSDMKYETEMMLRAMLSVDSSVTESQTNDAIEILRYGFDPTRGLIRVMKIREVAKSLGVCDATVHWYARIGLLDKVVGGGGRFRFGIAQDSFFRFVRDRSRKMNTERETQKPRKPDRMGPPRQVVDRDIKFRKAQWALRRYKNATRREKYTAIKEYLAAHPAIPKTIACEVLEIRESAFYQYWKHHPRTEARMEEYRNKVLMIVRQLHPDKHKTVCVKHLVLKLKARHVSASEKALGKILVAANYTLRRHEWHRHAPMPPPTPWYHDEDFIEIS